MAKNQRVVVTKNGPYVVSGGLPLQKEIIKSDKNKIPVKWKKGERFENKENYALCRCGHSSTKPFCDGTHVKVGFDGTETASKEKYLDESKRFEGPGMDLTDDPKICALAKFCNRAGGAWELTKASDDPKKKKIAIQEACDCPSGRLVAWDKKSHKPIEPKLKPSLSLVEDPGKKVSGPIWVKGFVPVVSGEGENYEVRNRMTLCRCGESKNKPFCDGEHINCQFRDDGEMEK